jgi:2-phosphosulfolactate phosphatase
VVIDALRASVTITQALASGCPCIHPALSVQDARDKADHLRANGNNVLLGGERAGVRPEGFDLGNSPSAYTPGAVGGREIVFTTTNGTATLLHARHAGLVLVACMGNVQTIADAIAKDARLVRAAARAGDKQARWGAGCFSRQPGWSEPEADRAGRGHCVLCGTPTPRRCARL